MTAPVDVLAVMRLTANLAARTGEKLASGTRPGHADYINKEDAALVCQRIEYETEQARAAVAELLEAVSAVSGGNGDFFLLGGHQKIKRLAALGAALARCKGGAS